MVGIACGEREREASYDAKRGRGAEADGGAGGGRKHLAEQEMCSRRREAEWRTADELLAEPLQAEHQVRVQRHSAEESESGNVTQAARGDVPARAKRSDIRGDVRAVAWHAAIQSGALFTFRGQVISENGGTDGKATLF